MIQSQANFLIGQKERRQGLATAANGTVMPPTLRAHGDAGPRRPTQDPAVADLAGDLHGHREVVSAVRKHAIGTGMADHGGEKAVWPVPATGAGRSRSVPVDVVRLCLVSSHSVCCAEVPRVGAGVVRCLDRRALLSPLSED
jgi:hypothetical protein